MADVLETMARAADGEAPDATGVACVFGACRGAFHPAPGALGVVLCSPWGFEDLAMRKSWRRLAEAIAAAGHPCLRFDYPGTGNALGAMGEIDDVERWTQSIGAAAEALSAYSGVQRFAFLGQSLGALLAAKAAAARDDVAALLLVAPVAKGRSYLRELEATNRMVAEKVGLSLALEPGEGLNVLGFSMARGLADDLRGLAIEAQPAGPGLAEVVVFDRADRRAGADVVAHYCRAGLAARLEIVAPYHLLVSDAVTIQPLPVDPASIVAALDGLAGAPAPVVRAALPRPPGVLHGDGFREDAVAFGAGGALRGILCQPARPEPGRAAVVFLNRGLNAQIGWRRVTVDHARALATQSGVASLRIDFAGMGESLDAPGSSEPTIYDSAMSNDVRAAVDALVARGHARVLLVGVCSGAYTALGAAALDPRVAGVVAVNPQRLVWNPAESVEDVVRYGLRSAREYIGDVRGRGALRKLVRSRKRVVPALRFLLKRTVVDALKARLPVWLRAGLLRDAMAARVIRLFADLSGHGTRVALVYSDGDPGLRELQTYYGPAGRNLRLPGVAVAIIPEADHNLTAAPASARLLALLHAFAADTTAPPERR